MSLSATVTSATKAALLVQSGALVGMGVSGVDVALSGAGRISVAVGLAVAVACVSVWVGVTTSAVGFAPQAEVSITRKRKTISKFFLIKTSLSGKNGEGRQFHYIQKQDEKTIFQKLGLMFFSRKVFFKDMSLLLSRGDCFAPRNDIYDARGLNLQTSYPLDGNRDKICPT
jgi:hypothetical protein